MTANYSSTDLIYGQSQGSSFGEITYSIIKNNSIQPAKVGLISYIPRELNDKLDAEIADYAAKYARETAADAAARKKAEAQQEAENPDGDLKFGFDDAPDDLDQDSDALAFAETVVPPQDDGLDAGGMDTAPINWDDDPMSDSKAENTAVPDFRDIEEPPDDLDDLLG